MKMSEETKTAIAAVNKFLYLSWNIPMVSTEWETSWGTDACGYIPTFLKEVAWTCNLGFMVEKWNGACADSRDSMAIVSRFYSSLDTQNRILLLEWVQENYDGECKLFQ